MCKNYGSLSFTHFVVAGCDGTIFGCARENGHVYNFLISDSDGSVRVQNGEEWFELESRIAEVIRNRAHEAYGSVPTYRTNRLLTN